MSSQNEISLIKEITEWRLEAKMEDNGRYFSYLNELSAIEEGSRFYVIGRRGTGKSAIAEYLRGNINEKTFAKKLNFKNFPFNELYALRNTRYTNPNQYITLWKLVIYSAIAKMMSENENIDGVVREELKKTYEGVEVDGSLHKTIKGWFGKVAGISIAGFGYQLHPKQQVVQSPDVPSWIDKVEELEKLIENYIDDSRYLIIFDELDEDYNPIESSGGEQRGQYLSLLTSLFKAVQDVKSIFPSKRSRYRILPIVFLRDDIYQLIEDPDKTKWDDLTLELNWNANKIRNLLAFRLTRAADENADAIWNFNYAWGKLFTGHVVVPTRGGKMNFNAFDYITRNTHMRPRDYIRYLQLCAQICTEQGHTKVGMRDVKDAESLFSNWLLNDVEGELKGVLEGASSILDVVLKQLGRQLFKLNEFKEIYVREVKNRNVPHMRVEEVLKKLFHFSIIGNQPRQTNVQIFRYNNKEASLNLYEFMCIHRGLYKALQVL